MGRPNFGSAARSRGFVDAQPGGEEVRGGLQRPHQDARDLLGGQFQRIDGAVGHEDSEALVVTVSASGTWPSVKVAHLAPVVDCSRRDGRMPRRE